MLEKKKEKTNATKEIFSMEYRKNTLSRKQTLIYYVKFTLAANQGGWIPYRP